MKNKYRFFYPPLLPLILALISGINTGFFLGTSLAGIALAAGICLVLILSAFKYRLSFLTLFLCLAVGLWGHIFMGRIMAPSLPLHHVLNFADNSYYQISGTVVSLTQHYEDKIRLVLDCNTLTCENKKTVNTSGHIRLNIYGIHKTPFRPLPKFGDRIQFSGPIHPIRNFSNPHGYDYKTHMQRQKIFGSSHVNAQKIKQSPVLDLSIAHRVFRQIEMTRIKFWQQVTRLKNTNPTMTAGSPRSQAACVLTALITGKKEVVSQKTRDIFAKSGASHILAISGLHLSLIAAGCYWMFFICLSRRHSWAVTGAARKVSGILTLIPLALYASFTGFSPSTQRALIMTIVFMVAILGEKEKDGLNSLCLAGIIILLLDPAAILSISFQLSFAAVLFIIIGFTQISQFNLLPKNKIFSLVLISILVTFFASLGTFPLIARYFNMVSHVQVFLNILVIPVMGFICLPLGFTGLFLMDIFPAGSDWILSLAIHILGFTIQFLEAVTRFEFTWSRVVTPSWADVGLIYFFMTGLFLISKTRKKKILIFLSILVCLGTMSTLNGLKHRFFNKDVVITVLDVGQGNCALIQAPSGDVILIDGGGFSGSSQFDVGRFLVAPFLWGQWIKTIDAVILTHPEADHMNGLVFVMDNFTIKKYIRNPEKSRSKAYALLLDRVRTKKIPQIIPLKNPMIFNFGSTRVEVAGNRDLGSNLGRNNNSLVSRIIFKDFSMLFPGDIEAVREKNLAEDDNFNLKANILLAPHHGSRGSSTKVFLDKTKPEGVIISCGYHNRYGFPHPEALKRYRQTGADIFRTDLQGAVTLTSAGHGYDIKTHRNH